MSSNENEKNYHTSAAAMVVAAAEKSGLLKEVAETLCFIDKNPGGPEAVMCRACMIRDDLAEAFDDHVCLPAITLEGIYGDGFGLDPYTDAELAPYLA
jgi:hypothetical protein